MYYITGADGAVYGPMDAAGVIVWIAEGRVRAGTPVHGGSAAGWLPLERHPDFGPAALQPGASGQQGAAEKPVPVPAQGLPRALQPPAPPARAAAPVRTAGPASTPVPLPPPSAMPSGGTRDESVSMGEWLTVFIALLVPGVNLILLLVWTLGPGVKRSKKTYVRALLLFGAILWIFWTIGRLAGCSGILVPGPVRGITNM